MKLNKIYLLPICLFSLTIVGCSNNNSNNNNTSTIITSNTVTKPVSGENISILNSKSYMFKDIVDIDNSVNFTTYKAKSYGDVPYIDSNDLKAMISTMADVNVNVKKEASTVTLTKTSNEDSYIKFDTKNNEISFKNPSLLSDSSDNKIGHDYCLTSGVVIKSSSATKVGTVGKDEGKISLDEYNIKMYEENDTIYIPYDVFYAILQPSSLVPYVFNGKDFFKDPNSYQQTDITSLCYSGNGLFEYGYIDGGYKASTTYKKINALSGQKYTYESVDMDGNPLKANKTYFALYNNGYGAILNSETNTEAVDIENKITTIKYVEKNDYLTMYLLKTDKDNPIKASEESFERKLVIYLGENRFAKKERSQELADFTYNLLCLSFDKLYSVKEAKKISSFDKFFTDGGYKENLKSKDIRTYEDAMAKFLNTVIDDGHTGLVSLPIFDYPGNTQITILNDKYKFIRTSEVLGKANNYYSKRYNNHDFNSEAMKIVGDTAYLSFDNFVSSYGIPSNFKSYSADSDIEDLRTKDTCGYMAACMLKIEAYNKEESNSVKIKNIVVDITANTGGDMTVLPYVSCIMTKDPKLCVGDIRTGQVVEYHYEADFYGDGTYGVTFADKYNFFLFTSDASFSCGSSLPAMVKGTNVKIIGMAGAGGASPITTFVDGSGLVYKTSGQFGVFYKDGDTYKTIENGVPVDYEIEKALWYDYENLTKKIDSLVKTN